MCFFSLFPGKPIFSVDIHPDGTKFATGGQGMFTGSGGIAHSPAPHPMSPDAQELGGGRGPAAHQHGCARSHLSPLWLWHTLCNYLGSRFLLTRFILQSVCIPTLLSTGSGRWSCGQSPSPRGKVSGSICSP